MLQAITLTPDGAVILTIAGQDRLRVHAGELSDAERQQVLSVAPDFVIDPAPDAVQQMDAALSDAGEA